MDLSFPKSGSIALGILSFFKIASDTIIGDFFRWLPFGISNIYEFFVNQYSILVSMCFVFISLRWTRNAYVLGLIGILAFAFLKYLWLG